MFESIADLIDPNDPNGRTYREVNNERAHKFTVGSLVELHHGERMFIVKQTRDCDGTPLYNIGIHGSDKTFNGMPENCLTLISQK